MFGYVSMPPGVADEMSVRWRREVETFANAGGYRLAGVFTDVRGTGDSGFYALITALRHEDAVAVVVPDASHLDAVGCLVGADLRAAGRYLRARVLVASG